MSSEQNMFSETEAFDINGSRFFQLSIDGTKITAKGHKWKTFVLMIATIGSIWIEKKRRFGIRVFIFGLSLAYIGSMMIVVLSQGGIFTMYSMMIYLLMVGVFPLVAGIVISVLWFFFKHEAIEFYTPQGTFRFEASAGLLDRVFERIKKELY